jgi:dienelactone hydrolase
MSHYFSSVFCLGIFFAMLFFPGFSCKENPSDVSRSPEERVETERVGKADRRVDRAENTAESIESETTSSVDEGRKEEVLDEGESSEVVKEEELVSFTDSGLQWTTISTPAGTVDLLYRHPTEGKNTAAVLYNHGKIVEDEGYEAAKVDGYDVADFVNKFADAGFAAFAPIRTSTTSSVAVEAAMNYVKGRDDVLTDEIFLMGFSLGGVLSIQYAEAYPADVQGLILLAPAISGENIKNTLFGGMTKLSMPVFVGLGSKEPNPNIAKYVPQFVDELEKTAPLVQSKIDYNGDHAWFYEVRDEFWLDVLDFVEGI